MMGTGTKKDRIGLPSLSCSTSTSSLHPLHRYRSPAQDKTKGNAKVYTYFVWEVLQPLPILLALTGIALLWLWYRGRESRRVLLVFTIPYALLVAFSVPALAYQLRGSLEWRHGPVQERP